MKKILLIEDDSNLASGLKRFLEKEAYHVQIISSLREAIKNENHFDLVILDWMLPDGQGLDYLQHLRRQSNVTKVLFLTAKADLMDKIIGLEAGASDYLVKPFEPRELLARIRAQLRGSLPELARIEWRNVILKITSREALLNGSIVETTRKEFDLMTVFMSEPDRVFSREELLNKIWGFDIFPTTRTVDTHVLQLRQKFGEDFIQTIRGIGYRLKTSEDLTRA